MLAGCCSLTLAGSSAPHRRLLAPPQWGLGGEAEGEKGEKSYVQVKTVLEVTKKCKKKPPQTSKRKRKIKAKTKKRCERKQVLTTKRPMPRQSPSKGSPRQPPPPPFPAEHAVVRCALSLCSVGVRCPRCVPSQRLVHPQPARWRGRRRSRKALGALQALLSTN